MRENLKPCNNTSAKMWTFIIFASITVASSRHVQYIEDSDFVAMLDDVFGVRSNTQDNIEDSKGFTSDASTRQVRTESTDYTNQQFVKHFHHGHHKGSNGHVHCDDNQDHRKTRGSNGNSTENTHDVNVTSRNADTNSQKINNSTNRPKPDNSTKTNPVTEKNTQTIKTESKNTTINQTSNNATKKQSEESKTPELQESRNVTELSRSGAPSSGQNVNTSKTDEDRWIWDSGTTTPKPTTVGLGDRAAFSGDGCPSSQVKVGNTCVDED